MSNGSFPPTSRRRGGAVVALVLVPVALASWLVWSSLDDRDDDHEGAPRPSATSSAPAEGKASASGTPSPRKPDRPLQGKVVVIDPGHNPHNREHSSEIARLVDIGTNRKECDTTGTATNAGYPEASFTLDLSRRVRTLLEAGGAKVIFTQDGDRPYGPCVDERAAIGNKAHADAAISIHADGAGAGQRGFHVIAPATVRGGGADTSAIAAPSLRFSQRLISGFAKATGSERSNYLGGGKGLTVRGDLGGLNLSTVPKVFIECGNMRDPKDAAQLTDIRWRKRAAQGIAAGITDFLRG